MAGKITLLDGALGTTLLKRGFRLGSFPEALNLTQPDIITDIQRSYVAAGSEIIYANTFGVNAKKAAPAGCSVREVVRAAIRNAGRACGPETRVALDIGSLGELMEPYGTMSESRAEEIFSEIIRAGDEADLIVLETMTDLNEVLAAVRAAKACSKLPIMATMSYAVSGRTITGCTPELMAEALEKEGIFALGINCSLGPDEAYPIMASLAACTSLPLVIKPNAGMPDPKTGTYAIGASEFADKMLPFVKLGVSYLGGCCGTDPEYIAALKSVLT